MNDDEIVRLRALNAELLSALRALEDLLADIIGPLNSIHAMEVRNKVTAAIAKATAEIGEHAS